MSQPIRIMPCLDMQNGRVVKGVHFVDIRDAGDPAECARAYCEAGADKVSTSSAAFRHPAVIAEMVREFGPEKVTVAIDVDRNPALPSLYEVYIDGGRTATGTDAVEWAKQVDSYGVQVILPTSKAGDGAKTGYDLPVIRAMKHATSAEIVASGGAGRLEHFYEAVEAGASILLAASVFQFHMIDIQELRTYLRGRGVPLK
jgi:cyclase